EGRVEALLAPPSDARTADPARGIDGAPSADDPDEGAPRGPPRSADPDRRSTRAPSRPGARPFRGRARCSAPRRDHPRAPAVVAAGRSVRGDAGVSPAREIGR